MTNSSSLIPKKNKGNLRLPANDKISEKIGEILINERLITKADIENALKIQEDESREKSLPLGMLLVEKGLITGEQLKQLMVHPYLRKQLGELAIENGFINREQLMDCLNKKEPNQLLGDLLIKEGLICDKDLILLLNKQLGGIKTGDLAIKLNMITKEELNNILEFKRSQKTIEEIFIDLKIISPAELIKIFNKYNKRQRIGEFLIRQGFIDYADIEKALYDQKLKGLPLGQILIEKNLITENQFYIALSRLFGIPFKKLDDFELGENQTNRLTKVIEVNYAAKNKILPLEINDKIFTIAVSNPLKMILENELTKINTGFFINWILISEDDFKKLFTILYNNGLNVKGNTSKDEDGKLDIKNIKLEKLDIPLNEKSTIRGPGDMDAQQIVNFIIKYGIVNGASDIHMEQDNDRKEMRLRYRINGLLKKANLNWLNDKLPEMAKSIISRIKAMSGLEITEQAEFQNGLFKVSYLDNITQKRLDLELRLAIFNSISGEHITIRILNPRSSKFYLDHLGHSEHVLEPFKKHIKRTNGIILVSGTAGSGKSYTLYGALQYINSPELKIVTIEDPIEYSISGITQTQVSHRIEHKYAKYLHSSLRLDPDVIMVGEIKDNETAGIAFDAAQTGHLILSSIYTNDAIGSITHLLNFNIECSQIASGLICVLAQRLVRKLCVSCKMKYTPDEKEWGILFKSIPAGFDFYRSKGCKSCEMIGYKGKTPISELFSVDKNIAYELNMGANENEIRKIALNSGMGTMLNDGLMKLHLTTLSEIIRVVPHEIIRSNR